MADDVPITAGIGTSIATDDVSGVHYQRMKLVDGTLNGTDGIVGDAPSGLFVNPKRSILRVQQTPAVSSGVAYTSGDQLGPLMTIANAARVAGNGGLLRGVSLLNKANVPGFDLDLLFFDRSVTTAADNAAATFSDADMAFCVGYLQLDSTDWLTAFAGTPANYILAVPSLNSAAGTTTRASMIEMPYVSNTLDLFCAAIVRGTPTLTSTSDLIFSFMVERF